MKSILALFLGFVFFLGSIFPNTDVEEVYKIPNLVQHYFEHKQDTTQSLSFWYFLQLHYGLNSPHAKSHQTDSTLPMFQHHCAGLTFVLPKAISFSHSPETSTLTIDRHSFYQHTYTFLFTISHLRPPKA